MIGGVYFGATYFGAYPPPGEPVDPVYSIHAVDLLGIGLSANTLRQRGVESEGVQDRGKKASGLRGR